VAPPIASALARRAASEPNVEVRSQLACSAKRLPVKDALPIIRALLARNEDEHDIHVPLLIWWALEAKVATDPELVLAVFRESEAWSLPIVKSTIAERLMRRFAAAGTRQDLSYCAKLLALAPGPDQVKRLMAGFESASAGRPLTGLPSELIEALAKYSGESITLGLRRGKTQALSDALHILADPHADRSKQIQILQTIGEVRLPGAVPTMLSLACESSDNALRSAALSALTGYADPAIGSAVIQAFASMSDDVLATAQGLLVTRRPWARQFLRAIDSGKVDFHSVPREIVEKFILLGDQSINDEVTRLWGPSKLVSSADHHARIARFAAIIHEGTGIPKPGKTVFDQQCARCHTLFGKGGALGPDLTTYRRDDLDAMLLNVVNPGAEIREGFVGSIVALADGRVLSGVIVEQDKNVIVLRQGESHDAILARTAIDTIRPCEKSLMPEGLLDALTAQQVRDLFAYLRSTQPLID
jgi:putative heme-binding domain-containing protein